MRKHLTKVKIIGAASCFLVLFFTLNFWSEITQKILNQQQSSISQELTISKAVQIEHLITNINNTSSILKSVITSQTQQLNDLSVFAEIIIKNTPALQSIRISPNDVTSHVFPKILTPKYKDKSILAPIMPHNTASQLSLFYSQPQLIDNQYHINSHIPLSINNKHWGYITYHINLDLLFKKSQLDILGDSLYSYQLTSKGGYNKSTILIQSETALQSDFHTAAINIPNNEWFLNLSFNGQSQSSLTFINLVFSTMLAFVFTLIGFLGVSEPSRLRQKIKRLTQQFEYHELVLSQIMDNVNDEIYVSDRNGNVYLSSTKTANHHHLPGNIVLSSNRKPPQQDIMFEQDGKTIIPPSEHPINKSLFNNESILKTVVISPEETDSYSLELRSQPIYDQLYNQVGAVCIGRKTELETENISTNTCRNIILDMLAHDKPINTIFEHIITETEQELENTTVAITLINPKTKNISNVISNKLPSFFTDTLIGLSVQERLMSNLSAIFHDKLIIVEDIDVHPFWVDYKMLAQQANLRSCWSQPIHDANKNVLGTVDIYSQHIFETTPAAVMILKEAAILCSLTLDRHRDSHRLQKMSLAIKHSSNSVLITDNKGFIEYINPKYTNITGFTPIDKLSTLVTIFDSNITPVYVINEIKQHLASNQRWQGEVKSTTKNRGEFWAMATITPIISDENTVDHLVFTFSDVTQINQSFNRIDYHNSHDPITKLYNRQTFEHRLQFLFSKSKEDIRIHSLCAINIDQYDSLKQQYGYEASDDLLRQISQILNQQLRKRDTLARLANDQFVVLMEDCTQDSAYSTAKEVTNRINGFKFYWENKIVEISLSIGISEITNLSISPQTVVQQADIACEQVKSQPDISVLIFQKEYDNEPITNDIYWANQIKKALEDQQFQLHIQPIIDINQSKLSHYEVLLRLKDEEGNLVTPSAYLPSAVRYNLSINIDKYVINKVNQWSLEQPLEMSTIDKYSINLSECSLVDESFTYYLVELASQNQLLFQRLIFEFSEYHLLNNLSHCRRFIDAMSHTQCLFSIDKFGRGLSSFTHIKKLPISYVKIDGKLINSMTHTQFDKAIVKSIQEINQTLNIKTIASHAESDEIVNLLKECGIIYGQGFELGKTLLLTNMK